VDGSFGSDDSNLQNLTSLVALLLSSSVKADSGTTYVVDANGVTVSRFQRALGSSFNPDADFNASSILAKWQNVVDFSKASFPDGPADFSSVLSQNQNLRDSVNTELLDFAGKVVIVTGAASG
jgi:multifunctional beta-oxidation protein